MAANGNGVGDTRSLPKWITEDYFSKILENHEENFKRITKFSAKSATQPGENYVSIMVRIEIEMEKTDGALENKSYILKTTLENMDADNPGIKFLNGLKPFPRETKMYENVLPKCSKLYKEAGLDIEFGPKCFHLEETPERSTFIMEDLKNRNFRNEDRLKGLDFAHMKATLEKLAELHAATAVLYELEGPFHPDFDIVFFNDKNRPMLKATETERRILTIKAMKQWGMENVDYYIEKLPDWDTLFEKAKFASSPDGPDGFNVLNHGDAWSNNIMFAHDQQGNIQDTIFVDFQMSTWGTPAHDLWYLITTSASLDIKIKDFDQFIFIYHKRLSECLKILKYSKKIPSLADIHTTMIRRSTWSYMIAVGVLLAVLLPSDSEATMENMFKNSPEADSLKMRSLVNPLYAKAMKQLFPFWEYKGVLDFQV